MKKSFTRVLSLVLVLVMMLGVLPMASADAVVGEPAPGVTLTDTATAVWNDAKTSATVSLSGTVVDTVGYDEASTWTVSGGATFTSTGSNNSPGATFTFTSAGTYTVTLTTIYTKNSYAGETELPTVTKFDTCTVTVPELDLTGITISGSTSVDYGKQITLTANPTPAAAELGTLNWTIGATDDTGAATKISSTVTTCTLKGTKAGSVTVTVSSGTGDAAKTASTTITVNEGYDVTVSPATLTLAPGGSSTLTATVKDSSGTAVTNPELSWSVNPTDKKISVDTTTGKVTADAAAKVGDTATVTATYTRDSKTYTGTCAVTIGSGTITCANISKATSSSNSVTISPTFKYADGSTPAGVTFVFTVKDGKGRFGSSTTTTGETATLTQSGTGVTTIEIVARKGEETISDKALTMYVSFYGNKTLEVAMKDGLTTLDFDEKDDMVNESSALWHQMLNGLIDDYTNSTDEVHFDTSYDPTGVIGKLTGLQTAASYQIARSLGNVSFQVTGGAGGVYKLNYTVKKYSATDVITGTGSVTIKFDGSVGDIEYSTDYKTAVTFKESDFAAFWQKNNMSSSLSYVQFNLLNAPTYGSLYTSTTSTATSYKATSTQKFYYGSYSDTSGKDLGSLTYVPNSTITKEYTVSIGFTAYGTRATEKATGTVVITLNASDNEIGCRGMVFGSGYDDKIAEKFKDATGRTLGYVVLSLPDAEDGTLYTSIPTSGGYSRVADASRLGIGVKAYYEKTSGKQYLANIAFVPAAGNSGTVTLYYTAYDTTGTYTDTDSLTLKISARTASSVFTDITAKSYSWAADSADFLYYEGTAQGSNGKYNPAAYITRQDFMLMIYRAFLEESYGTYSVTSNFPDVVKGSSTYSQEIYQAVGVAKYLGIAQGTNNKFNPTSNITRQEAMVLIYRTLDVISKNLRTSSGVKASSFKDYSQVGTWATTAITDLVSHGVIQGTNDRINPTSNITRAEMACILHRVITF